MSPSLDTMNQTRQRKPRLEPRDSSSGLLLFDERVLVLIFHALRWDIPTLCRTASINRRLRALAKRILWKELCAHHAPRMVHALTSGKNPPNIGENWHALAKLLFFCSGCRPTRHFTLPAASTSSASPLGGHFVSSSRFSKTSGKSFLSKRCRGDVLYVTDPCEHRHAGSDVVGVYRGVFRGFTRSRTREWLVRRGVGFEQGVACPYCGARVWSMTTAKMVPRKCAARRLGSRDQDSVEYFVCLNGHLHGVCWLVPLSSSSSSSDEEEEEEDSEDDYGDEEVNFGLLHA